MPARRQPPLLIFGGLPCCPPTGNPLPKPGCYCQVKENPNTLCLRQSLKNLSFPCFNISMIKYQASFILINHAASCAKLYLEPNLMEETLQDGIIVPRFVPPYHQN